MNKAIKEPCMVCGENIPSPIQVDDNTSIQLCKECYIKIYPNIPRM